MREEEKAAEDCRSPGRSASTKKRVVFSFDERSLETVQELKRKSGWKFVEAKCADGRVLLIPIV